MGRHGKFLDLDVDGLHLIVHLARAGWLQWRDNLAAGPAHGRARARSRCACILLRVRRRPGERLDLTEAGTQKRLAVYVVRDPAEVPGIARLGPDALAIDAGQLRDFAARSAGPDQRCLDRSGRDRGDRECLLRRDHCTRLACPRSSSLPASPTKRLNACTPRWATVLRDARRTLRRSARRDSKGEKRSGLKVHARAGLPCPVCGDTVREVSFADKSFQYCPTCQTEGRELADRRLSKLLK